MAEPSLPTLPSETISMICDRLGDLELRSLHRTNKELSQKTKYNFAKRFYTRVNVFLHPNSFEKLQYISRDSFYAALVEHVTISTHVIGGRRRTGGPDSLAGNPFMRLGQSWLRNVLSKQEQEYKRLCESERKFIEDEATSNLTDALRAFSKLKVVALAEWPDDWAADILDDFEGEPWGRNELLRLIDCDIGEVPKGDHKNVEYWSLRHTALKKALAAVAEANLGPRDVRLNLTVDNVTPDTWSLDEKDWHRGASFLLHRFTGIIDIRQQSSRDLLRSINPSILSIDYFTALESKRPHNLHFGYYSKLRILRLIRVSTTYGQLNNILLARSETLEELDLDNVLIWTTGAEGFSFPWMPIWETLSHLPHLNVLGLSRIGVPQGVYGAAPPEASIDFQTYPRWRGQEEITRGLGWLFEMNEKAGIGRTLAPSGTGSAKTSWVNLQWPNTMLKQHRLSRDLQDGPNDTEGSEASEGAEEAGE